MPHVDTPHSLCQAGVARCDITPPVGIYHRMWGAATHDRASGVHRPLTATALILRPDANSSVPGDEIVIVAIDHCLLWAREMADLVQAICAPNGLRADQVIVAFSHTHGAGLMGRERAGLPGGDLIGPYLDELGKKLAGLVAEARREVRAAVIAYGSGRCNLAAHRDFWDEASGQFVCGFNPTGPADDTVLVARIADSQGNCLGTIVNYACHPTTLAFENTLISPDYVGAMREVIESALSAPCVFLQGSSGDLGPREGLVGGTGLADRNGRQLGFAALSALEALPQQGNRYEYAGPVISGATLGIWRHIAVPSSEILAKARWQWRRWTVQLAYRPELRGRTETEALRSHWSAKEASARQAGDVEAVRNARAMVERMDRWLTRLDSLPSGPTFPFPITLGRMGDAFWLAVEGEHYQLLQRSLRERFPNVPIVVITLANGSRPFYLPTADVYGKGIYQETVAVVAPGSLERLIGEIAGTIAASLQPTEPSTPSLLPVG